MAKGNIIIEGQKLFVKKLDEFGNPINDDWTEIGFNVDAVLEPGDVLAKDAKVTVSAKLENIDLAALLDSPTHGATGPPKFSVVQGDNSNHVPASAGTHDSGVTIDFNDPKFIKDKDGKIVGISSGPNGPTGPVFNQSAFDKAITSFFDLGLNATIAKYEMEFLKEKSEYYKAREIKVGDEKTVIDMTDIRKHMAMPVDINVSFIYNAQCDQYQWVIASRLGEKFGGEKLAYTFVMTNEMLEKAKPHIIMKGIRRYFQKCFVETINMMEENPCINKATMIQWMKTFRDISEKELQEIYAVVLDINKYDESQEGVINTDSVEYLAMGLPGYGTMVEYPCKCDMKTSAALGRVIMHLNDYHGKSKVYSSPDENGKMIELYTENWTREKIADWIDKLHDDGIINAEFESWDENPEGNDNVSSNT